MRRIHPNESLRSLLREAGLTHDNLARAVNRVAAESCVDLNYDRTAVAHWLSGSRPRGPVPGFVAEALSRRLGRLVTIASTGLADASTLDSHLVPDSRTGTHALFLLATADLDPGAQTALREMPYRIDWAAAPEWPSEGQAGQNTMWVPRNPITRADPDVVAAVRATTAAFAFTDRAFGRGRLALAAYLATDVTVWMESVTGDRTRRELFSAVAASAQLIGAMCFDNLYHHLAQRYYRCALDLSVEAGDPVGYGAVLQGMSAQAWFLGHHRQAVRLAEISPERGKDAPVPAGVHAELLGQAAVAHAALSDHRSALACLAAAERLLDRSPPGDSTEASEGRANFAYRTGQVRFCFRDPRGAETALRRSLRHRAASGRRSRMLTTNLLAEIQFRGGRFEQACATWGSFLDDYPHMDSARIRWIFHALRRKLAPHRKTTVVAETLDRIDRIDRLSA
jgi:hypothetical protein